MFSVCGKIEACRAWLLLGRVCFRLGGRFRSSAAHCRARRCVRRPRAHGGICRGDGHQTERARAGLSRTAAVVKGQGVVDGWQLSTGAVVRAVVAPEEKGASRRRGCGNAAAVTDRHRFRAALPGSAPRGPRSTAEGRPTRSARGNRAAEKHCGLPRFVAFVSAKRSAHESDPAERGEVNPCESGAVAPLYTPHVGATCIRRFEDFIVTITGSRFPHCFVSSFSLFT